MLSCLVIKTSSMGDIFQTLPAVLALKQHRPDMRIDWVVEKKWAPVLERFKEIDQLIIVDFKLWKKKPLSSWPAIKEYIKSLQSTSYDLVLDFQANTKSAFILALARSLDKRSFNQVAEWPHRLVKATRIKASEKNMASFYGSLVHDLIPTLEYNLPEVKTKQVHVASNQKIIILGLGSMWPSKELPVDKLRELMAHLVAVHNPYFLIPALASQKALFESYLGSYTGQVILEPNLIDYLPYLQKCFLYIGVDSALLHLARLFKIPSWGLFGPSSSQFYGLEGDAQGACPFNICFIKRCPYLRTCSAPCMEHIAIDLFSKSLVK